AQPELWPAYIDAAASAGKISEPQARLVTRIQDQEAVRNSKEFTLLTRLGWVMQRLNESAKASALIERATTNLPDTPKSHKELAGVLAALGRNKEALRLYDGLPLTIDDRRRLAALYAAEKEFPRAEEQCRAILRENAGDHEALRQLAD